MSDNYDNLEVLTRLTKFLLNSDCVCGSKNVAHIGATLRSCESCPEMWGIDDSTGYEQLCERLALIAVCKVCRKTTEPEEYLIFINDKDLLEILCTDCQTPCGMDAEDLKENERSSAKRYSGQREGTDTRMRSLRSSASNDSSALTDFLRKFTLEEIIPNAPQIGMTLGTAAGTLLFKNPKAAAIGGMIGQSVGTKVAAHLKNVM